PTTVSQSVSTSHARSAGTLTVNCFSIRMSDSLGDAWGICRGSPGNNQLTSVPINSGLDDLGEYRRRGGGGVDAHHADDGQHFHDLVDGRSQPQRVAHVQLQPRDVEVGGR